MFCIIDTETSGKPLNFKAPPSDFTSWGAARLVQLAWIEFDKDGKRLGHGNILVKPEGFTIHPEAVAVHRITNERARDEGRPLKEALDQLREVLGRNKYLIAHNIGFDQNVMGSEYLRAGESDPLAPLIKVDTMKLTVNFVKAKSRWGNQYKWPSLSELHTKLFGTSFEEAHDALVDTEALARCFFKLQELGVIGFNGNEEKKVDLSSIGSKPLEKEELFKPLACLGVHTFFTLLRGAGDIGAYVKRAKELGHASMAITDRGNVSGSFEFFKKCKEAGIKPILGCELLFNDNIGEHEDKNEEGGSFLHKVIVKNKHGFKNLNKLMYLSHTDGFYNGASRVKTDWLIENKEGLMVSLSGHEGFVCDLVMKGRKKEAEAYILRLQEAFGEDLFVEVKFSELPEQKDLNEFVLSMAIKHGLTVTLDNDVHYVFPDDNELQDTVYAIGQPGVSLKKRDKLFDRRHLFYPNRKNFLEFNKKFEYHYPENALDVFMDNSLLLADRCDFFFEMGVDKYPKYEPTADVIEYFKANDTEDIIYALSNAKLKKKLKDREKRTGVMLTDEQRQKYFDRLSYELDVIKSKNMLDYFLINWELIRDYKSKNYVIGPGRGSAAGCLLSWALDITSVDPLRFGLYFERFLNPTRNCLTDDCVVLMKDGSLKNIVDVKVDDAVETESGKGELVQVHIRDITADDEVFELEMENGAKVKLTGDHIMPVRRDGRRVDIRVADLIEGDEMWVS